MNKFITVEWLKGSMAEGYTDLLRDNWFFTEGFFTNRCHDIRGPQSKIISAKCNVTVADTYADLDYTDKTYEDFNKNIVLGIMRIKFKNEAREEATQVLWKSKGGRFEPCDRETKIGYEPSDEVLRNLPLDELKKRALKSQSSKPALVDVQSKQHARSPDVAAYVKKLAAGICQLCAQKAPFKTPLKIGNYPYLEAHHIKRLADKGSDTISNTVALCPNCHRRMHVLDSKKDVRKLVNAVKRRENP